MTKELSYSEVAKTIRKEMPHLEFAIWDLTPFMNGFHNWRKNTVFVECEGLAVDELKKRLYTHFKSITFFSGTKRIRRWDIDTEGGSNVVILARSDFKDTTMNSELDAYVPSLEERATDLLAYALREDIPMPVSEAVNAIHYVLSKNEASITKMHRYATRKYVDWLFKIIIYELAKRNEISGVDPRFTKAGERYLKAVKEVENRE